MTKQLNFLGQFKIVTLLISLILVIAYSSGSAQTCQDYDIYGESLFRGYGFGVTNVHMDIKIDQNSNQCESPAWTHLETGACYSEIYEGSVGKVSSAVYNVLWVEPFTDDDYYDYIDGVTTADLVGVERHVQNIELITDPFKLIAADPTEDHVIDTDDEDEFTDLILGNITAFTRHSWEWFNKQEIATYSTSFNADPWNFGIKEQWPGGIIYNNLPYTIFTDEYYFHRYFDYRCTKIGEVIKTTQNSWVCGTYSFRNANVETRTSNEKYDFIPAGSEIIVNCYLNSNSQIVGLELPIYIDHSKFHIKNVTINKSIPLKYNYNEKFDRFTALMDNKKLNKIDIINGESIMKIELLTLKDAVFEKDISWDHKRNVEAVNYEAELIDSKANLELLSMKVKKLNAIYLQNKQELLITSNEDTQGKIQVYSLSGSLINEYSISLQKGNQTIPIDENLPSGMFVIKIKSNLEEISLKIIK